MIPTLRELFCSPRSEETLSLSCWYHILSYVREIPKSVDTKCKFGREKNAVAKSSRNHFPVVNDAKEFLGVIRLDDIRHMMFDSELYEKVDAESLMHADAGIINYENDSMNDIMTKFKSTGAWNLPVIKQGQYYGYISKSKLLTAYRQQLINFTK